MLTVGWHSSVCWGKNKHRRGPAYHRFRMDCTHSWAQQMLPGSLTCASLAHSATAKWAVSIHHRNWPAGLLELVCMTMGSACALLGCTGSELEASASVNVMKVSNCFHRKTSQPEKPRIQMIHCSSLLATTVVPLLADPSDKQHPVLYDPCMTRILLYQRPHHGQVPLTSDPPHTLMHYATICWWPWVAHSLTLGDWGHFCPLSNVRYVFNRTVSQSSEVYPSR